MEVSNSTKTCNVIEGTLSPDNQKSGASIQTHKHVLFLQVFLKQPELVVLSQLGHAAIKSLFVIAMGFFIEQDFHVVLWNSIQTTVVRIVSNECEMTCQNSITGGDHIILMKQIVGESALQITVENIHIGVTPEVKFAEFVLE